MKKILDKFHLIIIFPVYTKAIRYKKENNSNTT